MGTLTDAQVIELDGIGRRVDQFTFELLNTDRSSQGALTPAADTAPRIDLDTSRTTMRTLSGLTVTNPADFDLSRSRVRPRVTLQNGSTFSLGVLMFGTDARNLVSWGEEWTPELFDEMFLLDQDLGGSVGVAAGGSLLGLFDTLAGQILDPLGVPTSYLVSDVLASSPLAFKVGTSRLAALTALAAALGALPPFFDNDGTLTLKPPPTSDSPMDHIYEKGTRIVDGTPSVTNSSYKAPNRYIVVGDDVNGTAVRGFYDLPASSPNSYAVTGQIVTAPTHTVSGLTDQTLANLIAYVDSLTDRTTYATAAFAGALDPRHDVFDTVQFLGLPYLETASSIDCSSGGDHHHTVTRMWTP